jgi:hypothetical protein
MICPWEKIGRFTSSGELNRFLKWMGEQIAAGVAEEIDAPTNEQILGERWFRHIPSDARWRLVPADGPLAPGFWPIVPLWAVPIFRHKDKDTPNRGGPLEVPVNITHSNDGKRRMLIVRREDGFFRFIEERLYEDDPLGRPAIWGVSNYSSGIYETTEGAEAAARTAAPWFGDSL